MNWTLQDSDQHGGLYAVRAGELCPSCKQARLVYDGCLNLVCPQCGYVAEGGCVT